MWDRIFVGGRLATMEPGGEPYGAVADGAIAVEEGRIGFVGPASELREPPAAAAREIVDVRGRWVTPGLVDCHTHLVYGGERSAEFEERLRGVSYEEIARRGGGILSTVRATRAAGETELVASALLRLDELLAGGVTTVEIKSGYGLEVDTELRMLRAARRLAAERPVDVVTTFLGAHAVPPEYAGRADDYVDLVCEEMIPLVAERGLADAVDAFCERIAFDPDQVERVFAAAGDHGLPVKLHAEQLSNLGGAALVARHGGLSADHLEYLDEAGVRAMAEAGTVAVLLPGAFYYLGETRTPPIDLFRQHGVPMAVATDANPGSSPLTSLLLALNMACVLFRLTPEEALAGATRNAAAALGLDDRGVLEIGRRADLAVWDVENPAFLSYAAGADPLSMVVRGGEIVRA